MNDMYLFSYIVDLPIALVIQHFQVVLSVFYGKSWYKNWQNFLAIQYVTRLSISDPNNYRHWRIEKFAQVGKKINWLVFTLGGIGVKALVAMPLKKNNFFAASLNNIRVLTLWYTTKENIVIIMTTTHLFIRRNYSFWF